MDYELIDGVVQPQDIPTPEPVAKAQRIAFLKQQIADITAQRDAEIETAQTLLAQEIPDVDTPKRRRTNRAASAGDPSASDSGAG